MDFNAQVSEHFGKWKLMPTAGRCWPAISPTLSDSMTSANAWDHTASPDGGNTASRELTSSAADSPARTSATPESAPESKASAADCGPSTRESFASFDRDSSSWKTSQLCFTGEWSEFSETWPRAGTMRNGRAYEQAMLAPHTEENESGLLPTPRAIYGEHSGMRDPRHLTGAVHFWPTPRVEPGNFSRVNGKIYETSLQSMARRGLLGQMWPTPTAEDTQCKGNHPGAVDSLHAAVKLWPTPNATDGSKAPKYFAGGNPSLPQAVKEWSTPSATDATRGPDRKRHLRTDGGRDLTTDVGGQLNPTWVEWLMGYPLGWTALKGWATRSSRKSRNSSGKE